MNATNLMVDTRGGVTTATLNRPDKLNAIDNDLARALLAVVDAASSDASVRVLRLRGHGRAFCAGRDTSAAPTEEDLVLVQAVARALVTSPKPVVAQVHGWVVGAGLEWMLDADIVVAAESARFKLPEASLGVFVTGGLCATLPACAGLSRAKALMLLGEPFGACEARDWGLVSQLVPEEQLDATGAAVAARLAALEPEVASRFKRVLNTIGMPSFDRAVDLENDAQRALAPARTDGVRRNASGCGSES